MIQQIVFGILRHLLTAGGGILITRGVTDAAGVETLVGSIIAIAGVLWSATHKVKNETVGAGAPQDWLGGPANDVDRDSSGGAGMLRFATLWLLVICLVAPAPLLTGCASVQKTSHQAIGVTAVTVDAAMQVWAEYAKAGHAPAEQVAAVEDAYRKYFAAINTAIDIGKAAAASKDDAALTVALKLAGAAQANVIELVKQFLPAAKARQLEGGR